jgi:hypothetical protein
MGKAMANKMTPRERVSATIGGKKPDKLPIMVANSNTFICQYYGISVEGLKTRLSRNGYTGLCAIIIKNKEP